MARPWASKQPTDATDMKSKENPAGGLAWPPR